jgi:LPS export ABC transporter protein LptC
MTFLRKIACVSLCLVSLYACENDMQAIMSLDQKAAVTEEGTKIESYYSQMGKVRAKLTAPTMKRYLERPSYVEFNNGLKVLSYNDSLIVESTVTARYGKYFENDDNVFLRDSVVVINREGKRLDCNELNWDSKRGKFYSNKPVRISTPTDTIYGTGLESNQDFSNYNIISPRGQVLVQDSTLQ